MLELLKKVVISFYFSIKLNENKYLVSCFDVSGKNISASLETIMLSAFFAYLKYNNEIIKLKNEEILEIINYLCFDQTPASMFISAIFLFIDKKKRELEVFNCGFTNPYLYFMAKDNKAKMRTLQVNFPPMIIDAEINFNKGKTVLPITKHMKLFIYSDGLIEARNQYGHMYGDENLKKFVIKNIASPNKEFKKKLFSQIDIFMGDSPLVDDITTLLINFLK